MSCPEELKRAYAAIRECREAMLALERKLDAMPEESDKSLRDEFMDAAGKWAGFHNEITKQKIEEYEQSPQYDAVAEIGLGHLKEWLDKGGKTEKDRRFTSDGGKVASVKLDQGGE